MCLWFYNLEPLFSWTVFSCCLLWLRRIFSVLLHNIWTHIWKLLPVVLYWCQMRPVSLMAGRKVLATGWWEENLTLRGEGTSENEEYLDLRRSKHAMRKVEAESMACVGICVCNYGGRNMNLRDSLVDVGVHVKIILKWILKKYCNSIWHGLTLISFI